MGSINTPDRWQVVLLRGKDTSIKKVFAGWYGGYANGDSWKLSSGIIGTKEFEDRYEFLNHSGSLYICYKQNQGMSSYMGSIMNGWVEDSKKDPNVTIRLVDLETETI
jgi:hypothetical protein